MTYCPKYEVEVIMGCRGGLPVYKREHFQEDGVYDSSKDVYSDGLDGTGWTTGECTPAATTYSVDSPQYYSGDNGPFLGSIIYDSNGSTIGVSTISGNTPSSYSAIDYREYGYSFTATTAVGQNLDDFISSNSSDFKNSKVISISISVDDEVNNLEYTTRSGPRSTIIKMGKSIGWGDSSTMTLTDKFFSELVFNSETLVTVIWEQME